MLRPIVYLLILLAVILAGGIALNFLVSEPGRLVVYYNDRVHELTLFEAAVALVVLILAVLLVVMVLRVLIALIRFIAGDETAFSRFFARRRERSGFDALSKAYVALAAGDGRQAKRKAERAEAQLMRPSLTRIVNAQAAELAGDEARARTYYRALLMEPETAFVGTRGLLGLAMKAGDTERALKLAEHGRGLKPKDPEILETLYTLQSQRFDWAAARRTLAAQAKAGHLPAPEAHRRESALALAQSEDAAGLGDQEKARALAVEAARLDPTNIAAVTAAVRHLIDADAKRAATKTITEAWRLRPHPQLAAAFAAIEPDEAPAARRRRFEQLFTLHPDHPETKFLRAELALADRDWTGAHAAIEELRETEPSARSCAIMAAIARGRGEPDHVVRAWLARALGAPRDEAAEIAIAHSAMLPLLVESDEPRRAARDAGAQADGEAAEGGATAFAAGAATAVATGAATGAASGGRARPAPEAEDAAIAPDPAELAGAAGPEVPRTEDGEAGEAARRVARTA
jgi:HemY protein